jgi:hypothetical protein
MNTSRKVILLELIDMMKFYIMKNDIKNVLPLIKKFEELCQ